MFSTTLTPPFRPCPWSSPCTYNPFPNPFSLPSHCYSSCYYSNFHSGRSPPFSTGCFCRLFIPEIRAIVSTTLLCWGSEKIYSFAGCILLSPSPKSTNASSNRLPRSCYFGSHPCRTRYLRFSMNCLDQSPCPFVPRTCFYSPFLTV